MPDFLLVVFPVSMEWIEEKNSTDNFRVEVAEALRNDDADFGAGSREAFGGKPEGEVAMRCGCPFDVVIVGFSAIFEKSDGVCPAGANAAHSDDCASIGHADADTEFQPRLDD
ncbi:MAG: hypothetical protein G01um101420_916 [Parcubacteria group bacterium Gr01-1014_20]|nr:MAG: hypothetical protein G01um101420_916 [Parcubacteria group bacterium Gr01-1014_20]